MTTYYVVTLLGQMVQKGQFFFNSSNLFCLKMQKYHLGSAGGTSTSSWAMLPRPRLGLVYIVMWVCLN